MYSNKQNIEQCIDKIKLKKNILLLQGPIGRFFTTFKRFCYEQAEVENVFKISFHVGELVLFFDKNTYFYRGDVEKWGEFFKSFVEKKQIKQIFLLSSTRIYHQIAIKIAKEINIEVYVFEQGYIRPHYLTIERNGVNAETSLPKCPEFYLNLDGEMNNPTMKPYNTIFLNKNIKNIFSLPYYWSGFLLHASIYGLGIVITNYLINRHHVTHFKDREKWVFYHLYGYFKLFTQLSLSKINFVTRNTNNNWIKNKNARYYFYALQLASDTQITHNAKITIPESLIKVIKSFQRYAPSDTYLLIKHHPIDRGHNNYKKLIASLSKKYNVSHRVKYLHDCSLPLALKHSLGVIVINSTTGLSALLHKKPVICLSKTAIYDIPRLTYQNDLDLFWQDAENFFVDEKILNNFYCYLKNTTQFQGEFYAPSFTQWEQRFLRMEKDNSIV